MDPCLSSAIQKGIESLLKLTVYNKHVDWHKKHQNIYLHILQMINRSAAERKLFWRPRALPDLLIIAITTQIANIAFGNAISLDSFHLISNSHIVIISLNITKCKTHIHSFDQII